MLFIFLFLFHNNNGSGVDANDSAFLDNTTTNISGTDDNADDNFDGVNSFDGGGNNNGSGVVDVDADADAITDDSDNTKTSCSLIPQILFLIDDNESFAVMDSNKSGFNADTDANDNITCPISKGPINADDDFTSNNDGGNCNRICSVIRSVFW